MVVAVLADTYAPARCRTLPLTAWRQVYGADLVLHAGDVCTAELLDELAQAAPVRVAVGNCDRPEVRAWGGEDEVALELEGVRVAMVHDPGPRRGLEARLRRRFPQAQVVVFGHSHLPLLERHGGLLLLNPGSPTDRRRAPAHTMAVLRVEGGRVEAGIVQV